jgi:hypothetical protein
VVEPQGRFLLLLWHLISARPKAPESKRKFTFRYGIYCVKATYMEKEDLLPADEFQRFTHGISTTVGRNDTH